MSGRNEVPISSTLQAEGASGGIEELRGKVRHAESSFNTARDRANRTHGSRLHSCPRHARTSSAGTAGGKKRRDGRQPRDVRARSRHTTGLA